MDSPAYSLNEDEKLESLASPLGFMMATSNGQLRGAPHLACLSEYLVAVHLGEIKRLIISIPVRHGKSELTSASFPAWTLGLDPEQQLLLGGYGAGFAGEWGGKARDLLIEYGPEVFNVNVHPDKRRADLWRLWGHRGVMRTVGVGSGILGKGADKLLIDDPVRSIEDADNKDLRDKQWRWYKTARTRLQPGGAVVITMSRASEDDIAGRCLNDNTDPAKIPWVVVDLPAIALDPAVDSGPYPRPLDADGRPGEKAPYVDVLGREPGEALWPTQYDEAELEQTRIDVGPRIWNSQYQGRPSGSSGNVYDKSDFRYYDVGIEAALGPVLKVFEGEADFARLRLVPLSGLLIFQIVDLALAQSQQSDFSVFTTWGYEPAMKSLYLIDVDRRRLSLPQKEDAVRYHIERASPRVMGIEQMPGTGEFIENLQSKGFPVMPLPPRGQDKVARAASASSMYAAHRVFHPRYAKWLQDFEDEVSSFPNAEHDDQADCVGYAGREVFGMGGSGALSIYVAPGL